MGSASLFQQKFDLFWPLESPRKVTESWFEYLEMCFEEQNQNNQL